MMSNFDVVGSNPSIVKKDKIQSMAGKMPKLWSTIFNIISIEKIVTILAKE